VTGVFISNRQAKNDRKSEFPPLNELAYRVSQPTDELRGRSLSTIVPESRPEEASSADCRQPGKVIHGG